MRNKVLKAKEGVTIKKQSSIFDDLSTWDASRLPTKELHSPSEDLGKMKFSAHKQFGTSKESDEDKYIWKNRLFGTIGSAVNSLNSSIVGNEHTGRTATTLNSIADVGSGLVSKINPLGGMVNSLGKFTGNLIGGTKNRVSGAGSAAVTAVSSGLSFLGPVGMVAGAALNVINGIGGKRVNTVADHSAEFLSGYSGSQSDVYNKIQKYGGKKAGLFDFGFTKKGNDAISDARVKQTRVLQNQEDNKKSLYNVYGDYVAINNANKFAGYEPKLNLKQGGLFPELDNAHKLVNSWTLNSPKENTQKFQLGGKMNLIPEGSLHARKHNIEDSNPELDGKITTKGIPVISKCNGEIVQHAEIERNEWTLRKEFTEELESLWESYKETPTDEIAIEAGKLICYELLKNTDDRSGLIKSVK